MRRRAFTLVELLVVLLLMSILTTALVATVTMCMHLWGKTDQRLLAVQNCRVAMDTMVAEFRQAVPCFNEGTTPNHSNAIGYLSTSSKYPSALLRPNPSLLQTTQLWFTEFSPTFNFFVDGSVPANADKYVQCSYALNAQGNGNAITRTITEFTATGATLAGYPKTQTIVQASSNGQLGLILTWKAYNCANIAITAHEGTYQYSMSEDVYEAH